MNEFGWIQPGKPLLVLAPMEGVTDAPMRALLTERGGFGFCVSEFLRISQEILPDKTHLEHVPELSSGCKTPSGTPIQIQFLGGNEEKLAISALQATRLGAKAIDLNFGCPAPTVNRHDGGASILRYPERVRKIVAAVRRLVPAEIPVSAKLRLGWENMEDVFVNAEQARLGGASWITIHARTKTQGYAPPAHWKYIGEVRRRLDIPVVANGEIWSIEDFLKCQEETGCEHFMLGRGALGDPTLVHEIARRLGIPLGRPGDEYPLGRDPRLWEPILNRFSELSEPLSGGSQYTARRIKQWLKLASIRSPIPWFDEVKRTQTTQEFFATLYTLSRLR